MIKTVKGNILHATENIICHQVNCQGVMGAGLAKQIRSKYPTVFTTYKHLHNRSNPYDLLGTAQIVNVGETSYVANIFSQLNYGRGKLRYTDYDALRSGLKQVRQFAESKGLTVALPHQIGCGLAGGDWKVVYEIIEEVFSNHDVTLYDFN